MFAHKLKRQSSRLKGFFKLSHIEKLEKLSEFASLSRLEVSQLLDNKSLDFNLSDTFVENAIGSFSLPLGLGTNFKINGQDYLVPMAVEESSVIAAASNAARLVYENGGFGAQTLGNEMIGQIQLLDIEASDLEDKKEIILKHKSEIILRARSSHPGLVARGGGAVDLEVRCLIEDGFSQMIVHLHIKTCDAMGANLVNSTCETISAYLAQLTSARVGLRILSNLADRRTYKVSCQIEQESLRILIPIEPARITKAL
jgi:hydroxymethylglutaryl-CoA reductase